MSPLIGGAFGRKSFSDFILEAALLSRATGTPVKVVWTREDDLQHDFFHTVAVEHIEAGLDAHGAVTAWRHRSALPPINSLTDPGVLYQDEGELGQGMTDLPYDIPNLQAEAGPAPAHTRIGWYRSVINIPHAFAIGSFIDELAHAAGKDPRDFLLALLGPDRTIDMAKAGVTGKESNYGATFAEYPIETGRLRGVVELAARQAGWGTPLPAGEGRGIAAHRSFLSYVASVVQVRVMPDGTLIIPRVDIAIDAGFIAHPERVRAQLEGATIMGLGNALSSEITFSGGRVVQSNFDTYRVMRWTRHRARSTCTSCRATRNRAASASPASRPPPRPSATRSSPRRAVASASSPWAASCRSRSARPPWPSLPWPAWPQVRPRAATGHVISTFSPRTPYTTSLRCTTTQT